MFQILKNILFSPLAFVYWIVLQIRYFLYHVGLMKKHQFETPIISVGNLTVGGTGKTPMVHFIAKELKNSFPKIAIISRGYGRNSKGFQLVHDGKELKSNPEIAGDEPYLLANLLGNSIVAVDEDRISAIQFIVQKFNPALIILDDGFQQLGIYKDADILLLNASKPFSELNLLPLGFARETRKQINRAHILVLTKTDEFNSPDWIYQLSFNKDIFTTIYEYEIWGYSDQGYLHVEDIPKSVFAFCGIGDSNSFEMGLKTLGINPVKFKAFKDHEPYSTKTIEALIKEIQLANVDHIITTEKDIVKLPNEFLQKHHIFTLRIFHDIDDKESFLEQIKSKLERKNR